MKERMEKEPFENDRELWGLLGKVKPTEVSPFFARNVLREVRLATQNAPAATSLSSFFRKTSSVAVAGGALLLIVGVLAWGQFAGNENQSPATMASQNVVDETLVDLEIVLALDDLLALEENTLWLDTY